MSIEAEEVRTVFQEMSLFYGVWHSCLNCHNWRPNQSTKPNDVTEDCAKYNSKPPLRIIVLACDSWVPVVPF